MKMRNSPIFSRCNPYTFHGIPRWWRISHFFYTNNENVLVQYEIGQKKKFSRRKKTESAREALKRSEVMFRYFHVCKHELENFMAKIRKLLLALLVITTQHSNNNTDTAQLIG